MSDTMDNVAYHLVVVKFAGEKRAKQVVDIIRDEQRAGDYKVRAWAVVEVDEKGKAHVRQSGHGGMGAAIGAGAGLGTGALIALLGGPVGLIAWALGGALIGGLAGKLGGQEFDANQLKAIGSSMEPNSSGVVVVIEDTGLEKFETDMGETDGTVMTMTLGNQLSGEFATVSAIDFGEEGAAAE